MDLPVGNRFQASISPSGQRADIKDRKQFGGLMLLDLDEVRQLREKLAALMKARGEREFQPFAIKLLEKSPRHVITGMNEEDGRELLELLGVLEEKMVPL